MTPHFNPWWGCERVSPACDHCYAESAAKRYGHNVWGETAERRFFGDKHWNEPLRWDRAAAQASVPLRVFCASMADVFEDRRDLDEHRARLFELIERTPNLRWQLLTKRPQHVGDMVPWRDGEWPENVWLGTTAEDQSHANIRVRRLIDVGYGNARVLFVSYEPALGPVTFGGWVHKLDWIICGGESGHSARAMNPEWARSVRDECAAAGVPFFFKQWGCWTPIGHIRLERRVLGLPGGQLMAGLSKRDAGCLLDGVEHKRFPPLGPIIVTADV